MFLIKRYEEWNYILLRRKEISLTYSWLFSEWTNRVMNTESLGGKKKVCGKQTPRKEFYIEDKFS